MERNCRFKVAQRTGEMSDVAGLLPECRSAPSTIGRYLPPIAVCRRSTDCCRRSIQYLARTPLARRAPFGQLGCPLPCPALPGPRCGPDPPLLRRRKPRSLQFAALSGVSLINKRTRGLGTAV